MNILWIKIKIISFVGRGGYTLDKMSKEQLERKIQLCNNYIGKQANIYK